MSLRQRIMAATVCVVVLTVLTSAVVAYLGTESRLGVFVDQIGDERADQLAQNLSRAYTEAGGWQTVSTALTESGYAIQSRAPGTERSAGEENHIELFHQDPVRVVVLDANGVIVLDNFGQLAPGSSQPGLDGHRENVLDLASNQHVGQVYVDVNEELLSTESHGFLSTLLYIILIAGLITTGAAVLLALWLSKRITAPVQALTAATQAVARGDATRLEVVTADELGQMSEAFNRMSSTLETQRELRRQLVNDVSHELNTPLSVIQLEAAGLRDGLQSADEASDHIIREVERLRGLVTDLDSLAETDYGALRLNLESTSIGDLLRAETERWQPQAQLHQVSLSHETPIGLPDLNIDRGRMSQALGNVLNNAIRSVEPGGSVVVRAQTESGETTRITVTDDGIGIDASDLPRIFDRFFRAERSPRREFGGSGLGLAITRAIVEAHGGSVSASSDGLGRGTTVTIRLPRETQPG